MMGMLMMLMIMIGMITSKCKIPSKREKRKKTLTIVLKKKETQGKRNENESIVRLYGRFLWSCVLISVESVLKMTLSGVLGCIPWRVNDGVCWGVLIRGVFIKGVLGWDYGRNECCVALLCVLVVRRERGVRGWVALRLRKTLEIQDIDIKLYFPFMSSYLVISQRCCGTKLNYQRHTFVILCDYIYRKVAHRCKWEIPLDP